MMASGVAFVRGFTTPAAGRADGDSENRFDRVVAGQGKTTTFPEPNADTAKPPPRHQGRGRVSLVTPARRRLAHPAAARTPIPAQPSLEAPSAFVPDKYLSVIGKQVLETLLKDKPEALAALKTVMGLKPGEVPEDADVVKIIGAVPDTYLSKISKQQFLDLLANKPEALADLKKMLGLKPGDLPKDADVWMIIGAWDVNTEAKKHEPPKANAAPS
jgi:hypothetical protein